MSKGRGASRRLDVPERHRFTRRQFEKIAASGIFRPDAHLELIEGDILCKAPPLSPQRATGIRYAASEGHAVFGAGYLVRIQLPLALGMDNEPLPDIAVVTGSDEDYEDEHPTTAVLVIEVSDSTLRYDRNAKASIYARAGIADYWLVNLAKRQLEVRRNPMPIPGRPLGYGYAEIVTYHETDSIAPLAAPHTQIAVADLLPRRRA